jgi:polyhydroxyalkanoate synthesis regulator phasin
LPQGVSSRSPELSPGKGAEAEARVLYSYPFRVYCDGLGVDQHARGDWVPHLHIGPGGMSHIEQDEPQLKERLRSGRNISMMVDPTHSQLQEHQSGPSAAEENRTDSRPAAHQGDVDTNLVAMAAAEPAATGAHAKAESNIDAPGGAVRALLLPAVVAVLCGSAGAWLYDHFGKAPASSAPSPGVSTAPNQPAAPAIDPSTLASASDVDRLTKRFDDLVRRMDNLQERLAGVRKPEPPPNLSALQTQMAALLKDDEAFSALPSRLNALDERLEALDRAIAELRNEVKTGGAPKKKATESLVSPPAPPPPP